MRALELFGSSICCIEQGQESRQFPSEAAEAPVPPEEQMDAGPLRTRCCPSSGSWPLQSALVFILSWMAEPFPSGPAGSRAYYCLGSWVSLPGLLETPHIRVLFIALEPISG